MKNINTNKEETISTLSLDDKIFIERILNDISYQLEYSNFELIKNIIDTNKEQDYAYIWTKIPTLKMELEHVKGYISVSNTKNKFKITYDKESVSEFISKEFYQIITKWSEKYKINLDFDFEKEVFYI